ncbi:MAG: ADP-ribosylglycohydrolase family protein [Firmicutes bacterium]|nr:ADP-ribosylglycohydrolase family protein [Bacillota bacterium]
MAESLVACRGFDGRHMAETFVRNFEREPWRGYGPGPPRIFRRIKHGVPWDRAAEDIYPGGSFGNGAAMRVAPVVAAVCGPSGSPADFLNELKAFAVHQVYRAKLETGAGPSAFQGQIGSGRPPGKRGGSVRLGAHGHMLCLAPA